MMYTPDTEQCYEWGVENPDAVNPWYHETPMYRAVLVGQIDAAEAELEHVRGLGMKEGMN